MTTPPFATANNPSTSGLRWKLKNKLNLISASFVSLSARERLMVLIAFYLVLGAFIWWVLLSPALNTLKNAPSQQLLLDQEIQAMQKMALEAKTIRAESKDLPRNFEQSLRLLSENSLPGQTNITSAAGKLTVTLDPVSGQKLLQWLEAIRTELHSKPQELQIKASETQWQGTVVFLIPNRPSK